MRFVRNGKYIKWFRVHPKGSTYISKKDPILQGLAKGMYLSSIRKDLQSELNAVLQYQASLNNSAVQALLKVPEYKELLTNIPIDSLSDELNAWKNEPYNKCPKNPENLIHPSLSGNILRSKSEATIDMLLYQAEIPYRYECLLTVDDISIYPDFTIRHPITGDYYYWEHFGLIENPGYLQSHHYKMNFYLTHNFIPGYNLITTYETPTHPFTNIAAQQIIEKYFL